MGTLHCAVTDMKGGTKDFLESECFDPQNRTDYINDGIHSSHFMEMEGVQNSVSVNRKLIYSAKNKEN